MVERQRNESKRASLMQWTGTLMMGLLALFVLSGCQPITAETVSAAEMESEAARTVTEILRLNPFGESTQEIAGSRSMLTRSDGGIDIAIDAVDLAPNEAYTLWWVIFNNPQHCADIMCMGPDIETADTAALVGYATGAVSDENGQARFVATLRVGDTSTALDNASGFPWQLLEPSPGLIDPFKAEVHAVIRTHGAVMDNPYQQLTTFNGGCNPECGNRQSAVHAP